MLSKDIIYNALVHFRNSVIERSINAGQKATGNTYNRITVENVTDTGGAIAGPTWIGVWEDGRRPGNVPTEFYKMIMDWANAKGIAFGASDPVAFERWAKSVAWVIRTQGTKLYREGGGLDIFKTPTDELKEELYKQFLTYYNAIVIDEIRTAYLNT